MSVQDEWKKIEDALSGETPKIKGFYETHRKPIIVVAGILIVIALVIVL